MFLRSRQVATQGLEEDLFLKPRKLRCRHLKVTVASSQTVNSTLGRFSYCMTSPRHEAQKKKGFRFVKVRNGHMVPTTCFSSMKSAAPSNHRVKPGRPEPLQQTLASKLREVPSRPVNRLLLKLSVHNRHHRRQIHAWPIQHLDLLLRTRECMFFSPEEDTSTGKIRMALSKTMKSNEKHMTGSRVLKNGSAHQWQPESTSKGLKMSGSLLKVLGRR